MLCAPPDSVKEKDNRKKSTKIQSVIKESGIFISQKHGQLADYSFQDRMLNFLDSANLII